MSQPPAFQFYASDFLGGTAEMTLPEVGLYIRLLCHQWIAGSVPADPSRLPRLAQTTAKVFTELWPAVSRKFKRGSDGRLRNARLETAREKQRHFREQMAAAGRKGGLTTQAKKAPAASLASSQATSQAKAFSLHSSSSSSSSSSPFSLQSSKRKAKRRPSFVPPLAAELRDCLAERIKANNPEFRVTTKQLVDWAHEARLMMERDRRDPARIKAVIEWCQDDPFWRPNILSMGKLRKQYDQLWMKMHSNGGRHDRAFSKNDPDVARRALENVTRRAHERAAALGRGPGSGAKAGQT